MAKRERQIPFPKSSKGLEVRGTSKKTQGQVAGKAWEADKRQVPKPTMGDRGPGSAFANALMRDEAKRLKSEAKVPGNLGYKKEVDVKNITHRTILKKK
jgi:hypothetical protein